MRWTMICAVVVCAGAAPAADEVQYPLWDGVQPVEDYARSNGLKPTETLDLGAGISLELRLIPAGRFIMGTSKPVAPVRTVLFGQVILCSGLMALAVLFLPLLFRSFRQRRRPQLSLMRLLLITLAASVCLMGALEWRAISLEWREYGMALDRYAKSNANEKPAHDVTISRPFYIGAYPVTQQQFVAMTGKNPSLFKGQNLPVDSVTWDDAHGFCKEISVLTRRKMSLPTEAQWEYACRAGTTASFSFGNRTADLDDYGWYTKNSGGKTHPVGEKKPNAFGLFDMHGNLYQWCEDFDSFEYSSAPQVDPLITASADSYRRHIIRGGSWYHEPKDCRSASRGAAEGSMGLEYFGFRVAMLVEDTGEKQ